MVGTFYVKDAIQTLSKWQSHLISESSNEQFLRELPPDKKGYYSYLNQLRAQVKHELDSMLNRNKSQAMDSFKRQLERGLHSPSQNRTLEMLTHLYKAEYVSSLIVNHVHFFADIYTQDMQTKMLAFLSEEGESIRGKVYMEFIDDLRSALTFKQMDYYKQALRIIMSQPSESKAALLQYFLTTLSDNEIDEFFDRRDALENYTGIYNEFDITHVKINSEHVNYVIHELHLSVTTEARQFLNSRGSRNSTAFNQPVLSERSNNQKRTRENDGSDTARLFKRPATRTETEAILEDHGLDSTSAPSSSSINN